MHVNLEIIHVGQPNFLEGDDASSLEYPSHGLAFSHVNAPSSVHPWICHSFGSNCTITLEGSLDVFHFQMSPFG
jgi:hypothetical protein